MPKREDSLIAEIERDALDDGVSVATALRKCIILGGRSGSEALRDWATRELKGYGPDEELPPYRVIGAPIKVDAFVAGGQITGQQFAPSELPEFARERIREEVELRDGIGVIEAMLKLNKISLMPSGASDIANYMNATIDAPFQQIVSIYWSVSHSAIHGVLDQVRTSLTQLVAELRATMGDADEVPSAHAATAAVHVVVTGKRSRVNVAAATAPEATARAATSEVSGATEEPGFWTSWRKVGAFAVGLATIAATVVAVVEFAA
jgi:hypothetical protein